MRCEVPIRHPSEGASRHWFDRSAEQRKMCCLEMNIRKPSARTCWCLDAPFSDISSGWSNAVAASHVEPLGTGN